MVKYISASLFSSTIIKNNDFNVKITLFSLVNTQETNEFNAMREP